MIIPERSATIELRQPFLSKGEFVYNLLKERVLNETFERDTVYTIVEIAESLGVSRTPVGEAVKILASQNYVTLFNGVGFKVRDLNMDEIRETLTINGALEEVLLRKIVEDGTPPSVELEDALERSWAALYRCDPYGYSQASADFHAALSDMAGMPRVTRMINDNCVAHESFYRQAVYQAPAMIERLLLDHGQTVDLIQRRHCGRIQPVMQAHVAHCLNVLQSVLDV